MNQTVTLPLWLVVLVVLLAAWTLLARLLLPSLRWFFRRRLNRLIGELNKHLSFKLPAIGLTTRQILIDRLTYDPEVVRAVVVFCEQENAPREVAMARVNRYAREIVPAFNPYVYFRFASWLCDTVLSLLYRVRLGHVDQMGVAGLDKDASIVFVMNHRSNMDYLLISYLTMRVGALSYAVGEWARVWPLQQLVRAMGGYFVRRGSGDALYRRVLERYVQMAVESGAVQAVFPEGGLSRDGHLREPRIGLLDYMLRRFNPESGRDIVFVPVGINYDRVLEDRSLLLVRDPGAEKRSGLTAIKVAGGFVMRNMWRRLRRRWYSYGHASANFGAPISLRSYLIAGGWSPLGLDKAARVDRVLELAHHLMHEVGGLIPVLPVSLVAHVLLAHAERGIPIAELNDAVAALQDALAAQGAHVYVPREDPVYTTEVGLRMLTLRRLADTDGGVVTPRSSELPILRYYANAIAQLTESAPCQFGEGSPLPSGRGTG